MTSRFERVVAERHRAKHALATTSCTAALHLAALALELGPGDEVIVPAFTWVTSAHCAEYVGAKSVFVDIDADSFNIDIEKLAASITPRTRAIVAVHLFGLAADMDAILTLAQRHGLSVIEDAACAIGTSYKGHPVGVLGDIGCFSFHPRKIITTGEGGMVTTNRDELAKAIAALRNHGSTGLPDPGDEAHGPWTMATFDRLGFNLRLSDIQAAVGLAQMAKLERLLTERRGRAERYSGLLAAITDIAIPTRTNCDGHSFQSYVVRVVEGGRARRNRIMDYLGRNEIATRPGTHAVHRLGYYRNRYGYRADSFPVASRCEDTTITLPLFPGMSDSDQDRVIETFLEALSR
jgi:dTDP-4-amino-4,6-dideoxygalactose transaminase